MSKKYLLVAIVFSLKSFMAPAQVKVGEKAPEIHITNWIKNVPPSKDLHGKFIVIDFWATWCAPCLESVPHMNNLVNKNKSRSNLVFLSITDEKEDKVNWLLKKIEFSSAVVSDISRQTLEDYKVKSIPLCVVIGENNTILWAGNPVDLTNEIIDAIIDRKGIPNSSNTKQPPVSEEVDQMYETLTNRYATNFNDQDLKEYFSMTLSLYKKGSSAFTNHTDDSYKEMIIGDSLIKRISVFLDAASNQILLPANLAGSYISYLYKSEKKTEKKYVFNTVLNQLNLKYTVSDSLMDVIQLEVSDKTLLKKFNSDSLAHVGHFSWSDNYAGLNYERFSYLSKYIGDKFQKVVVFQQNSILNSKMSLTVKIDNFQNLVESLQLYGIKATLIKKKMPVYRFIQKK